MAFWGRRKASESEDESLTNGVMVFYVSSYGGFLATLRSSGYPLESIDEKIIKECFDEFFSLLLLTKYQRHNIRPEISKVVAWLVASRVGVEEGVISVEQRQEYLNAFDGRLNEAIKLFNDGYPIELVPVISLTSRVSIDTDLVKERMPQVTQSLKKYKDDLDEDLVSAESLRAAAVAIAREV